MGVIYKHGDAQSCLARFEDGVVYLGQGNVVLGKYSEDTIYDAKGIPVATYKNNEAYSLDMTQRLASCNRGFVLRESEAIACYHGSEEGACAAAVLICKDMDNAPKEEPIWTLRDLWINICNEIATFVKVLAAVLIFASIKRLFELPTAVSFLISEPVGIVMLGIWGFSFVWNLLYYKEVQIRSLRQFYSLLFELLVPYLHSMWILFAIQCVQAMMEGRFSLPYLAGLIAFQPSVFFTLTLPLCFIQIVYVLYLIYKQSSDN